MKKVGLVMDITHLKLNSCLNSPVATKLKEEISKNRKKGRQIVKMKWTKRVGDGPDIPEAEQVRSKSSCISLVGFMFLPLINR